jgi:thioredoxin reductase (NADPH)
MDKWGLDVENNLIKVTSDMQTSKPGIYAIGNSVTYLGKRKMIATALGEAATAISAISQYLYPEKTITYKH